MNCSFVDGMGQRCDNVAHFEISTEVGTEPYRACRAHTWEALRTMAVPGAGGVMSLVRFIGPGRLPEPFLDFDWDQS